MDQINLERKGIPTVTVATSQFIGLAKAVAVSENAADYCLVTVPHPLGMLPIDEITKKADEAIPTILDMATSWQPSGKVLSNTIPVFPAERFEFTGTVSGLNNLFFEKGWSTGLPITPSTPEQVTKMLGGTNRRPEEVLGLVPPRMASLTVELVAVHAAMAGCKPEYMPILITALEAFLNNETNWRGALTTTATTQFIVMVNGPVVKAIGLATGQGSAGKGYHANASIGYAISLIAYVIGGSRPPSIDKSTLGSPGDHVCWVFGENEDELPSGWEPMHVGRGFKKSDSVVTVIATYPPVDNLDHWSVTAEDHIKWWSHAINPVLGVGGPCHPLSMHQYPIVAVGPEHAQLMASAGWSKEDFQQALWEHARAPLSAWPSGAPAIKSLINDIGPVDPKSMIPITLKPDQLLVIMAGGAGKHSHYFPQFPGCYPSSKLIAGK